MLAIGNAIPLSHMPGIDMRSLVAEHITVVRTSQGWDGFFLQERQGPRGHLDIPTGTRQHVVVCYLESLDIDVESAGRSRRVAYRPGDARLVPAGSPIRYRWHGSTRLLLLGIEPEHVARVLGHAEPNLPPPVESAFRTFPASHGVSQLMQLLAEELPREAAGHMAAAGLVQALVAWLFTNPSRMAPADQVAPARAVHRAVCYMRAHLAESVSVDDLAAATGISAAHFSRQFKAATGFPPHEYLLRLRIARAQELLLRQGRGLNIAGIATDCGFADQSHLRRVFKRVIGMTPAAFLASGLA
jgi:AraC family transcriptional regulator